MKLFLISKLRVTRICSFTSEEKTVSAKEIYQLVEFLLGVMTSAIGTLDPVLGVCRITQMFSFDRFSCPVISNFTHKQNCITNRK